MTKQNITIVGARLFAFLFLFTVTPANAAEPASVLTLSGSLKDYLLNMSYGTRNDNQWTQPTEEDQLWFAEAFNLFISGHFELAQTSASQVGYQIVAFSNTDSQPPSTHYILREISDIGDADYRGGGTYVLNLDGSNVVIEAPHPKTDAYTENQAIDLYLGALPRLLAIAGTRRDSSTETSQCSGVFRESDAVHNDEHLFYVAHQQLNYYDANTVFVQLHGVGTTSLSMLQKQCLTNNDNLVNISEGVEFSGRPNKRSFSERLRRNIKRGGIITACVYGKDTQALGGTTNTTGRLTNGSRNSCWQNAERSSKRFIHLEQSYSVRTRFRNEINRHIHDAIRDYTSNK